MPLAPLLSSSPLSTLIEAGRQKWVAMAECIIFEMLSHRRSADAGSYHSLPHTLMSSAGLEIAVSNCLPPATKWAARRGQASWIVCQKLNRSGVTTSKKKKKPQTQERSGRLTHHSLSGCFQRWIFSISIELPGSRVCRLGHHHERLALVNLNQGETL